MKRLLINVPKRVVPHEIFINQPHSVIGETYWINVFFLDDDSQMLIIGKSSGHTFGPVAYTKRCELH